VSAFELLIADLETAVQKGQQDKRVEILRQVTDLFVVGAQDFKDDHVDLFGDVLMRLTAEVETRALAELSAKLAPVANAPDVIIQRFARDDAIAVAGPVLTQSVRLSDTDLIEIAKSKGQMHLGAISERARLAAAVTDVLVERGDTTVVRKLSLNRGASFSDAGYTALAKRAESDGELAVNLGGRVDLPSHVLEDLVSKATETVRARLMTAVPAENQPQIQKVLAATSAQVALEASGTRDFRRAEAEVTAMKNAGQLTEESVTEFSKAGYYEGMVAALAQLCGAPIDLMAPMMQNNNYNGVLVACKAADFHWGTLSTILSKRFPHRPISLIELEQARAEFGKLTVSTAQRVFRFWLVRGIAKKH
jgi:uncharacterized protein (DUF2336 family)